MNIHTKKKLHKCMQCAKGFTRGSDLKHHNRTVHANEGPQSSISIVKRKNKSRPAPSKKIRTSKPCEQPENPCSRQALETFNTITYHPEEAVEADLQLFLQCMRQRVIADIRQNVAEKGAVKWYVVVQIRLTRMGNDGEEETIEPYFRSLCMRSLTLDEVEANVNSAMEKVVSSFDEFQTCGSGWTVDKILQLELKLSLYRPLAASSYIPLPKALEKKKAILNIKNEDEKCFLWSVIAGLYPPARNNNAHRVAMYKQYELEINVTNIKFPMSLTQVSKFEKLNDVTINVFGYEGEVFPLYITANKGRKHINLLMISSGEKRHYCLIKNMSRLLRNLTKHKRRVYYCDYCLHRFVAGKNLEDHLSYCREHEAQRVKMPEGAKKILQFENIHFQQKIPYVVYADFESLLLKTSTCTPNPQISHTQIIAEHEPCGYAYVIVGPDGQSLNQPVVYRGENVVEIFLNTLILEEAYIKKLISEIKPLHMTNEQECAFRKSLYCHICSQLLNGDSVRDHCHFSGEYRGSAHRNCNLKYRTSWKIPVVFHNLRGYDSHHIIQGIGKIKNRKISCIANNMEKFITFSLGNLQFINSLQFMAASLNTLVENLDPRKFHIIRKHIDQKNVDLLLRKGIYPYEYLDDIRKFEETQLPPRSAFFSQLNDQTLSVEDYEHAHRVWNAFNIANLGEYHDLYVMGDVLLLADVFENFRELCLEHYKIDPCHVYTASGLSWQACLKMTGVKMDLITDITMHLFLERGIRGGTSMISNRFSKANNKYLDHYDSTRPSKYIIYYDCSNLYGWGMRNFLPLSDFRWMEDHQMTTEQIMSLGDEDTTGMVFEVDLEYPENLHDLHSDYPLAPEKVSITPDMLSPYSIRVGQEEGVHQTANNVKLVPNLNDKVNYIIHYRNLQQYLKLGMRLKRVHKILAFTQKPWLREYIDYNTEMRKNAKNTFEKDFFKLLNNAVYGKTMENLRSRVDIQLVTNEKKAKKLVSAPTFHAYNIITPDLAIVQRKIASLTLNRPIYAGFAILELSKMKMYDFHYSHIQNKYKSRAKLLFTDTDSLCYEIETEDVYRDMCTNIDLYDTSEYPKNHFLYSDKNKKVVGTMKDEFHGVVVEEFVGLRSKMYSIKTTSEEKKTAKGVLKHVIKNKIKHLDYKKCLLEKTMCREDMVRIASRLHRLQTVKTRKVALCPFDDKRYILENGCDTIAHGHYKTKI